MAHRLVFGYGELTWEWVYALRGFTHVLPFAGLYKLLQLAAMDSPAAVVHGPRVLQSVVAALADIFLVNVTEQHICPGAGRDALLCSQSSWFVWYCGVRTYSSCMEAALLGASLSLLPPVAVLRQSPPPPPPLTLPPSSQPPPPQQQQLLLQRSHAHVGNESGSLPHTLRRQVVGAAVLAALAFVVRPSAAVWLVPCVCLGGAAYLPLLPRMTVAVATAAALSTFLLGLVVDCACYGAWVSTAATFARFNLLRGGASYYGTHPWHWYLSSAVPAALGTHLPLVLNGMHRARGWSRAPALTAAIAMGVLSLAEHKELRFIYPLVHPLLMAYAGVGLSSLSAKQRRCWLLLTVASNGLAAAYLSTLHQRAPLALMFHLRRETAAGEAAIHLDVLTRCHQTPAFAQMHAPIRLTMLHCPPPAAQQLPLPLPFPSFPLPLLFPRLGLWTTDGRGQAGSAQDRNETGGGTAWLAPLHRPLVAPGLPFFASSTELRRLYPAAMATCANECDCFFNAPGPALASRYGSWWRRRLQPGRQTLPRPLPSHVALFDELYSEPAVHRMLHRLGYIEEQSFFQDLVWSDTAPWPKVRVRRLLLLRLEHRRSRRNH